MTPETDPARRIQVACTPCGAHELRMLEARANLVLVRCAACEALYWLDTGMGKGGRPESADALPAWPYPWGSQRAERAHPNAPA